MKITQITYSMAMSLQVKEYQNIKPMFSATASLEEKDDIYNSCKELKDLVEREIKESCNKYKAGIDKIRFKKMQEEEKQKELRKKQREEAARQRRIENEKNKKILANKQKEKEEQGQKINTSIDSPQ